MIFPAAEKGRGRFAVIRKRVQLSIFLIITGALMLVVHSSHRKLDENRTITFVELSPQFLPRGKTLKALSMGYRGIVADWLWIKSVLYYGRRVIDEDNPYYLHAKHEGTLERELDQHQQMSFDPDTIPGVDKRLLTNLNRAEGRGLVNYIYPLLDRVTTIDPHFILPYIFGGVYVLIETGEYRHAEALLKKGYEANPGIWKFPFYLGWIQWVYRGNVRAAHSLILEAMSKDDCPVFVGRMLAGLSKKIKKTEKTRIYLEALLHSTDNEEIREKISEVLQQLSETR